MLLKSMNTSVSNVFNFVANHIFVCGQLIIDKHFYKQFILFLKNWPNIYILTVHV